MAMPAWISELQVFGTFALGGGAAWLGLQQYKISKRKLKLDLYEKRWSIYNAMRLYLTTTYDDKEKLKEATLRAYEKKAEARFLLDKKACQYLDNFVEQITKFNNTRDLIGSEEMKSNPREVLNLYNAQADRTAWIMQQYEPLIEEFVRFLNVDHNL